MQTQTSTLARAVQRSTADALRDRRRRVECCRLWQRIARARDGRRALAVAARAQLGMTATQARALRQLSREQVVLLAATMADLLRGDGEASVRFSARARAGARTALSITLSASGTLAVGVVAPTVA